MVYILQIQEILKHYVFSSLELNRLWSVTSINNNKVISSLEAAGFRKEGTMRHYLRNSDEKYYDAVIYGLLSKEYFEQKLIKKQTNDNVQISKEEIAEIISKTLECKVPINISDSMQTISDWDSLNHIQIIISIEEKTGYKFSPIEISRAVSIEKIQKILFSRN